MARCRFGVPLILLLVSVACAQTTDNTSSWAGVTYYPQTLSAAKSINFCHAIWQPETHKSSCVEYFLELTLRSSHIHTPHFGRTGIPAIKCEAIQEK
jgi:hypothetical protein